MAQERSAAPRFRARLPAPGPRRATRARLQARQAAQDAPGSTIRSRVALRVGGFGGRKAGKGDAPRAGYAGELSATVSAAASCLACQANSFWRASLRRISTAAGDSPEACMIALSWASLTSWS